MGRGDCFAGAPTWAAPLYAAIPRILLRFGVAVITCRADLGAAHPWVVRVMHHSIPVTCPIRRLPRLVGFRALSDSYGESHHAVHDSLLSPRKIWHDASLRRSLLPAHHRFDTMLEVSPHSRGGNNMRRTLLLATFMSGWIAIADAAPEKIATEEAMVPSLQSQMMIYVRNKHPESMANFDADHTLVFVHGATYPASTSFDLELGGQSWMDFIARHGFDVYSIDLPGYGHATRQSALDQPADANEPFVETTADAVADYNAVVEWVCGRRHIDRVDAMGWSWGTTIAGGFAAEHPEKVHRLVLYASLWLSQNKPPTTKVGAYRTVTRASALERWMNGVPNDKKVDLIPDDWFDRWQQATWATDPKAASVSPPALRAPNGVAIDFRNHWMSDKPTYDPSRITAPTLIIQAEWDRDAPPYMSQALFPLLTHAAWKQYDLIGEGTHMVMMEKNRQLLFDSVQGFLEEKPLR
jgi:pimeloyl-ACP methyl ester carboxylesterase